MRFGVVTFPESNCDRACVDASGRVFGHDNTSISHMDPAIPDVDCVVLPGGVSCGDYLRAGSSARVSPIMRAVAQFAEGGGVVFGICNGFQILLEAGLPLELIRRLIREDLLDSAHDISDGGLSVALAECVTSDRSPGCRVLLPGSGGAVSHVFGEYAGGVVVTYSTENGSQNARMAAEAGVPLMDSGEVGGDWLSIEDWVDGGLTEFRDTWSSGFTRPLALES